MRMLGRFFSTLCFSFCFLAVTGLGTAKDWFVAPAGSDKNPGTGARPFATLERARDAVRTERQAAKKAGSPISRTNVWLAGGTYAFAKTFELKAEDSGSPGAEIVYRAAQGARVCITGGHRLDGWKKITDQAVSARLDAAARDSVRQVDLKARGVDFFRKPSFGRKNAPPHELFFDGAPMTLARWPNGKWAKLGALPDGKEGLRFKVDDARIARWAKAPDIRGYGYWFHLWSAERIGVAKVDVKKGEIVLAKKHHYGLKSGRPYIVENLLEELDAPGEWYLDRRSGVLYFWPPAGSRLKSGDACISVLEGPLIRMRGTSHVAFSGILFEAGCGDGVVIEKGEKCVLMACTVRNFGKNGVVIKGGKKHRVAACEITAVGSAGVTLDGGNRKTLEPAGHEVVDCNIHHYARLNRTYQPAVRLQGVGSRVAHNHLHHAPHVAVLYSGNDHRLEYNDVHHVCRETDDAGAFYIGRNWTTRGHLVLHNHFHEIGNTKLGALGAHHVYLDDCASGVTIRGNFFEKGNRVILIGGGRDNVVENNLFIAPQKGIHVDDRGLRWKDKIKDGGSWGIYRRLRSVPYDKPPYSTRYPGMANILENTPHAPLGNRIERNIFAGGIPYGFTLKDKSVLKLKDNWTEGEPGFVDAEKGDYRLRPDAPARKTGFQKIPFDKIGPRTASGVR